MAVAAGGVGSRGRVRNFFVIGEGGGADRRRPVAAADGALRYGPWPMSGATAGHPHDSSGDRSCRSRHLGHVVDELVVLGFSEAGDVDAAVRLRRIVVWRRGPGSRARRDGRRLAAEVVVFGPRL